jgi:hypothetical protein
MIGLRRRLPSRREPAPKRSTSWRVAAADDDDDDEADYFQENCRDSAVGEEAADESSHADEHDGSGKSSDDGDSDDGESSAELARWCRRQLRESGAASVACRKALAAAATPDSLCPQRLLQALGTSAAGRGFLEGCAAEYAARLRAPLNAPREASRLHAAHASVLERLGDAAGAEAQLRRALAACGVSLPAPPRASSEPPPLSPLAEAPLRDAVLAALRAARRNTRVRSLLSSLVRLRRQLTADGARAAACASAQSDGGARMSSGGAPPTPPRAMPRASLDLSIEQCEQQLPTARITRPPDAPLSTGRTIAH